MLAIIGATAGAAFAGASGLYAANKRSKPAEPGEEEVMLTIPADAAQVEVAYGDMSQQQQQGRRYVALARDVLMIGRQVGPAEDLVLLADAEVGVIEDKVTITCAELPPVHLWPGSAEEAQAWAEKLSIAAGFSAELEKRCQQVVERRQQEDHMRSARIGQLEARLSATLRAAMERSKRIAELEGELQETKKRDDRIKELEDAVQESVREAAERSERVRELEAALEARGAAADGSYTMIEDAMSSMDTILGNREELVMDGGSVLRLRESLGAVREASPNVDQRVADLMNKMVVALRWPVALRHRLADAEEAVKEQAKESQLALEAKAQAETEVMELRAQLVIAAEASQRANARLEELQDVTKHEEFVMLKKQYDLQAAQRQEAEAEANRLRQLLAVAQSSPPGDLGASAAAANGAAAATGGQEQLLRNLQGRLRAAEDRSRQAEDQLAELKIDMVCLESNTERSVQEADQKWTEAENQAKELQELLRTKQAQTEKLLEEHEAQTQASANELRSLKNRHEIEETKREQAESNVTLLRQRLVQLELSGASGNGHEPGMLMQEAHKVQVATLQEQLKSAEGMRRTAETQSGKLKEQLLRAEREAEKASIETDEARVAGETNARALKDKLAAAEEVEQRLRERQQEQEAARVAEIDQVQADARRQTDQIEQQRRELKERLDRTEQHYAEVRQQQHALDEARQAEVVRIKQQHAVQAQNMEAARLEAQARATALESRLAASEQATLEQRMAQERLQKMLAEASSKKPLTQPVRTSVGLATPGLATAARTRLGPASPGSSTRI